MEREAQVAREVVMAAEAMAVALVVALVVAAKAVEGEVALVEQGVTAELAAAMEEREEPEEAMVAMEAKQVAVGSTLSRSRCTGRRGRILPRACRRSEGRQSRPQYIAALRAQHTRHALDTMSI